MPKKISSKYPFQLKENYAFMNGSLAFSSGCLLLTALYRLLPEAVSHFKKSRPEENYNFLLLISFIGGIFICGLFNQGLHMLTTESVVHCSHDGETENNHSHNHNHNHNHNEAHNHSHDHNETHNHSHNHNESHGHNESHDHNEVHAHSHNHNEAHNHNDTSDSNSNSNSNLKGSSNSSSEIIDLTETSALLTHDDHSSHPPTLTRKKSLIHFLAHGSTEDEQLLGECKGYTSAELCHYEQNGGLHFCEVPQFRKGANDLEDQSLTEPQRIDSNWDSHSHHKVGEHHHHHVNSPMSRLLLIGIQTILAITLHKFPEGFITYITLKTNPQLGVSIFLSLLIHNYTEGFSMCLPLYYSFGESKWRKWKAVAISAFLGGFSQPAGAFFGYLFMAHLGDGSVDVDKLNYVFGVSMAMTAGFLTVIALSMYGSAVSFSGLPNFVCIWSLLGMCLICLSTIFTNRD